MIELVAERSEGATGSAPPSRCVVRLAGHRVVVTPALPEVAAYLDPAAPDAAPVEVPAPGGSASRSCGAGAGTLVYRGPAWIGQRRRALECRRTADGFRIDVDGIGRLEVAADGRRAGLFDPGPALASAAWPALRAEALLGPALILALALRGTLSVHASALALPLAGGEGVGAVAFLGPSGAGKSTLARLLDGARPGWRRAADDILPLGWDRGGERDADAVPTAFPRFPQLKLDASAQPGARLPEALPLVGLFVLAPRRGQPPERPIARALGSTSTRPLTRAEAALALVRHTASARLFDRALLGWHLELCSALAERLPVAELTYPWSGALAPGLVERIERVAAVAEAP